MGAEPKKLEPPDLERCQADILTYNPWRMGGPVRMSERCKNKAHWLVKETKPGADGLMGSMTVCDDCAKVLINKFAPDAISMDWIGTI